MPEPSDTHTLLIIEDDVDVSTFLKAMLSRENFNVFVANDGLSGLQLLQEQPVDIVLLDWMMPHMDGLEVLRRMHAFENPPPVLMLSAKNNSGDIKNAIHEGAADYVQKPVQRDILLFKLHGILAKDENRIRQHAARRASVNLKASVPFVIMEITAGACMLESTFPLGAGNLIILTSDQLGSALDQTWNFRLTLRVTECLGHGTHYHILAEHVGLSPQISAQITRLNQKNAWPK